MAKKPVKKAAPAKKAPAKSVAVKAAAIKPAMVAKPKAAPKPKNANNTYTYAEFVENVRAYCGLEKRTSAKTLCEDLASFLKDSLKKGYKVPLLGLGKLFVRESKARMGRNPSTGDMIKIPARRRVRFTATKALKDAVLK